jgi:alkanesulfonate monooxygenase SsuD/methylene tetrahydromethanopterin reductase-like flavin-dependent oxidoreductase (luciferase family)
VSKIEKLTGSPVSPSGKPPPVILGAAGGSRLASTAVRLITGHASFDPYTAFFYLDKLTYYPDS